jgi:4-hydroxybenzoate polyprenyltransferase
MLSTALAAAAGRTAPGCVLVFLTVLTGQLSIGWSNDAVDAARDQRSRRSGKPVATGLVAGRTVATAAGAALVACVPLSLANGLAAGIAHLLGVAGGWAYNLGLKRTWLSWVPYATSFALLPAFIVLGLPGAALPPLWLLAAGALLGVSAHLFNVLPDLDDDRAEGVLSLPVRLGRSRTRWTGCALLMATAIVLVFGPPGEPGGLSYAGLVLATTLAVWAAVAGRDPQSRLPFVLVIVAATVNVALLIGQGTVLA